MSIEETLETLKKQVVEKITENYDNYFREWISDPWHAEIPQLYIGVVCSYIGSIREKFPGLLGDLSVKHLETMAENLCYAIESFISINTDHTLDSVTNFAKKMLEFQFENNEVHMLFEEEDSEDPEN